MYFVSRGVLSILVPDHEEAVLQLLHRLLCDLSACGCIAFEPGVLRNSEVLAQDENNVDKAKELPKKLHVGEHFGWALSFEMLGRLVIHAQPHNSYFAHGGMGRLSEPTTERHVKQRLHDKTPYGEHGEMGQCSGSWVSRQWSCLVECGSKYGELRRAPFRTSPTGIQSEICATGSFPRLQP